MKRGFTRFSTGLLVSLLVLLALGLSGAVQAQQLEKVTFRLDTSVLPKHGLFFAALGKGFYEEEGLDVTIVPSSGSYDTSVSVASGRAEFGFADAGTMILARAEGAMVRQLAVIHALSPFAVVTLKDSGIETWSDLRGKLIAGEPSGSTTILFPIALELAGLKESDVQMVTVDAAAKAPGLLAGRWDAFVAYHVSDPPVIVGLGYEPHSLLWSDVGFEQYSNGIITTDEMIRTRPDLVQRFVRATLRGVKWAADNPEEAAKILVSYVPEMNLVAAEVGIRAAAELLWTEEAKEHGLGWMIEPTWQITYQRMKDFFGLEGDFELSDFYTNEFNPGILPDTVID